MATGEGDSEHADTPTLEALRRPRCGDARGQSRWALGVEGHVLPEEATQAETWRWRGATQRCGVAVHTPGRDAPAGRPVAPEEEPGGEQAQSTQAQVHGEDLGLGPESRELGPREVLGEGGRKWAASCLQPAGASAPQPEERAPRQHPSEQDGAPEPRAALTPGLGGWGSGSDLRTWVPLSLWSFVAAGTARRGGAGGVGGQGVCAWEGEEGCR